MTNRRSWPLAVSRQVWDFSEEMLRGMQDAGVHYMELSSGHAEHYTEKMDYPHRAKEVYRLARDYDVTIFSIHLPFWPFERIDPAIADPECRRYTYELQSGLLGAAADSGIKTAVIHASGSIENEAERPEKMKRSMEMIESLTRFAASAGITLAVENLSRTCLCRTHDEMLAFLAAIPDLRVCYDTNHSLIEPNTEYIRAVSDKIVTLHISDYDLVDQKHWFPMDGKIDWGEILSLLEEINYRGYFTYEVNFGDKTIADLKANYEKLMQI